ncbi:MAG: YfiR family protein [Acidobacteriota bacterium]
MKRFRKRFVAAAAAALLASAAGTAAPEEPTEWEVKAAFLFNFTRFVEWPEDPAIPPDAPFVVGILGPDPFGRVLDATFAGRTVGTHPVVVRRLERPEQASKVQILFLAGPLDRDSLQGLRATYGKPVLTVGDANGAAPRFLILAFRIQDSRVRFEVNLGPARAAGLKISSQLLKLALAVEGP